MQGETERGSAGGALIWAVLDVPGAVLVTDRPLIGYSSCTSSSFRVADSLAVVAMWRSLGRWKFLIGPLSRLQEE